MLKRTVGIVLMGAGATLLVLAAIILVAVVKSGSDWTGKFLVRGIGGLGAALLAIGLAIFRGRPLGTIEKRPTSLVTIIPALLLFGILLVGAVALFLGNFELDASGERWAVTAILMLFAFFIVFLLVRDVSNRFATQNLTGQISTTDPSRKPPTPA